MQTLAENEYTLGIAVCMRVVCIAYLKYNINEISYNLIDSRHKKPFWEWI